MQFIFTQQVIHFEWMPDCPVKDIFDEYAHASELSEGSSFSIEQVIEWANDEELDSYTFELDDFMADNNVSRNAEVRWEW